MSNYMQMKEWAQKLTAEHRIPVYLSSITNFDLGSTEVQVIVEEYHNPDGSSWYILTIGGKVISASKEYCNLENFIRGIYDKDFVMTFKNLDIVDVEVLPGISGTTPEEFGEYGSCGSAVSYRLWQNPRTVDGKTPYIVASFENGVWQFTAQVEEDNEYSRGDTIHEAYKNWNRK